MEQATGKTIEQTTHEADDETVIPDNTMQFREYQEVANSFAVYPGQGELMGLLYATIGLAGEAGEFANKVKKILRDNNGLIDQKVLNGLIGELGGVLWYHAACCSELGIPQSYVASTNIEELSARKMNNKIHGNGDNR